MPGRFCVDPPGQTEPRGSGQNGQHKRREGWEMGLGVAKEEDFSENGTI